MSKYWNELLRHRRSGCKIAFTLCNPVGPTGWHNSVGKTGCKVYTVLFTVVQPVVKTMAGASKGTPGDANCVTEILGGGTKIRKLGGK